MNIVFSITETKSFLVEIISSAKTLKKNFSEPDDIFEYFKEEIPLSNAEIAIKTGDPLKKIIIKNLLDKILKYQKNNGITLQFILQKNKLKKLETLQSQDVSELTVVLKIAGNTMGLYNSSNLTKENLAMYGLYADVLVKKSNDLLKEYSGDRDSVFPANQIKNLSDILVNLNNLIKNEYIIYKNFNLISLRNHLSKIMMRFEEKTKNLLKPDEEKIISSIRTMNKTKKFIGLEKYITFQ